MAARGIETPPQRRDGIPAIVQGNDDPRVSSAPRRLRDDHHRADGLVKHVQGGRAKQNALHLSVVTTTNRYEAGIF